MAGDGKNASVSFIFWLISASVGATRGRRLASRAKSRWFIRSCSAWFRSSDLGGSSGVFGWSANCHNRSEYVINSYRELSRTTATVLSMISWACAVAENDKTSIKITDASANSRFPCSTPFITVNFHFSLKKSNCQHDFPNVKSVDRMFNIVFNRKGGFATPLFLFSRCPARDFCTDSPPAAIKQHAYPFAAEKRRTAYLYDRTARQRA